jgi:antitoxin component YwqK of YwqJK toxin-antitoxin module
MKRVPYDSLDYLDGRMCLDGEPFTGVAFELYEPEGVLDFEVAFQNGIRSGPRRAWFETGQPSEDSSMFSGVLHGKHREWHRNGQLSEESDYELGFKLRSKCWDEKGNLIEDYKLPKDHPNHKRLVEVYRPGYKDAPPIETPID